MPSCCFKLPKQHSCIHFLRKQQNYTSWNDLFKETVLRFESEKSPAPTRKQTFNLCVMRDALYRCATFTALSFNIDEAKMSKYERKPPDQMLRHHFFLIGLIQS